MSARLRALATAVVASLALTGSPAHAADVYVMTGTGTIVPGLDLVPVPQSVSFSGTASYVRTFPIGLVAAYPCSFSGTDLAGSAASGVGTLSGSCGPVGYSFIAFVRVGTHLTAVGSSILFPVVVHFDCVLNVTDLLPTTSFSMTCAVEDV